MSGIERKLPEDEQEDGGESKTISKETQRQTPYKMFRGKPMLEIQRNSRPRPMSFGNFRAGFGTRNTSNSNGIKKDIENSPISPQLKGRLIKLVDDKEKIEEKIIDLKKEIAELNHLMGGMLDPIPGQNFGRHLTEEIMEKAKNKDGQMICYICGREVTYAEGEIDHVIPRNVRREVIFDKHNLRWVHGHCNRNKGDKPLSEVIKTKSSDLDLFR